MDPNKIPPDVADSALPRCRHRRTGALGFFFPFRSARALLMMDATDWGVLETDDFIEDWEPINREGLLAMDRHCAKWRFMS